MKLASFATYQSLGMLAIHAPLTQNALSFSFAPTASAIRHRSTSSCATSLGMTIVSPFDNTDESSEESGSATSTYTPLPSDDEPLDLTWENVDLVLEEMRPYLLQDGGNVAISEIDGPIVRLELQVRVQGLINNISVRCM
jgi:lysyl-tRNA synthetase class 2